MILTVTANSALDRVIFIDRWEPGTVMRTQRMVDCVGGKGFDTSVVLRAFDVETVSLGIMAGATGKLLECHLLNYGIRPDLVWVEGETRIAHVISETEQHRHSHLMVGGYSVSPEATAELFSHYRTDLQSARYVVIGGSIPAGLPVDLYGEFVRQAHQSRVPVIVDCPGNPMLAAIQSSPDIVKMNGDEFGQTFQCHAETIDQLVCQALDVKRERDISSLVLTLGKKGILAFVEQGVILAKAPLQAAVNAAGAGDAVSAMLAWRLSEGDDWQQALRWAAARQCRGRSYRRHRRSQPRGCRTNIFRCRGKNIMNKLGRIVDLSHTLIPGRRRIPA